MRYVSRRKGIEPTDWPTTTTTFWGEICMSQAIPAHTRTNSSLISPLSTSIIDLCALLLPFQMFLAHFPL